MHEVALHIFSCGSYMTDSVVVLQESYGEVVVNVFFKNFLPVVTAPMHYLRIMSCSIYS